MFSFKCTKKKQTISDDFGIWYKGPVIKLESGREIWYPVVDIYPESGMEGVLFFEEGVEGRALINGPFRKLIQPLKKQLVLDREKTLRIFDGTATDFGE